MVTEGLATIIRPGEAPTSPARLDRELNIEWLRQERRGNRLSVSGRIEPTNALFDGDQEIPISPTGYFELSGNTSLSNRSFVFTVQNPLGESRDYRIQSWQFPDLGR